MCKYQKTKGYWVYAHTMPDGKQYIGMSKQQPSQRWKPSLYKDKSLSKYIERFGWENIEHTVLLDGLTKQQAEQWEDQIITALRMNGLCINSNRSGGHSRDNDEVYKEQQKAYYEANREEKKTYNKAYYEAHREQRLEQMKAYHKQRRSTPEGKIYNRVNSYNRRHPDRKIITPMEAKEMYELTGYIPDFIKHDDLI